MPRSRTGVIKPFKYTKPDGTIHYKAFIELGKTVDGKRRRKAITAKTYKECNAKIKQALQEIRDNGAPIDKRTGFATYANAWLDYKRSTVDPASYKNYRYHVDLMCRTFGEQTMSSFTATQLRDYIYNIKGKTGQPLGIDAIRQAHSVARQIFTQAMVDRVISYNPMYGMKVPQDKNEGMRRALSVPEIKALLETASHMDIRDGAIWWFRLLTGLRQGEILGATWDDYNPNNHTYTVNWQLVRQAFNHGCIRNGKPTCGYQRAGNCPQRTPIIPVGYEYTDLDGTGVLARPKSKTGRVVPIIPALAQVLEEYRQATLHDPNPYNLIFHQKNGTPITASTDRVRFKEFVEQSGLDPNMVVGHMTRHSVVTILASQGVDFQLIKEIVGHSNDATLMRYRHSNSDERQQAMEALDTALQLPRTVEFHQD